MTKTLPDLTFTLVSDGSSDRALVPLLCWLVERLTAGTAHGQWADFSHLRKPPLSLPRKITTGLDLWPADMVFVHRDAERVSYERRRREVLASFDSSVRPAVCVVPVRMMEAWLLTDVPAIRTASGNPQGKTPLRLPPIRRLEGLPNPKAELHELLRQASGLNNRRRQRLEVYAMVHDVASATRDFSRLFALPAFRQLAEDVKRILVEMGWPRTQN